jgi:hypothetical protein
MSYPVGLMGARIIPRLKNMILQSYKALAMLLKKFSDSFSPISSILDTI